MVKAPPFLRLCCPWLTGYDVCAEYKEILNVSVRAHLEEETDEHEIRSCATRESRIHIEPEEHMRHAIYLCLFISPRPNCGEETF